ncbi:MAG: GTP-binding protein, partial [Planctomycetota bacterium]
MSRTIPTHIITGFLGAGKTTTINRLLEQSDDESVLVVINEMGQVGIDA